MDLFAALLSHILTNSTQSYNKDNVGAHGDVRRVGTHFDRLKSEAIMPRGEVRPAQFEPRERVSTFNGHDCPEAPAFRYTPFEEFVHLLEAI